MIVRRLVFLVALIAAGATVVPAAAAQPAAAQPADTGAPDRPADTGASPAADGSQSPATALAVPDPATLDPDVLVIATDTGLTEFTVEIADDPIERARGLMFRETMDRRHGMLFDFKTEGPRSFWMRNTPLPLDMIFARADGTVVSIGKDTVPFSLDAVDSEADARFVFEVNAGVSDEIGLEPGDRLIHRRVVAD